jgi:TP901 family phage tail tape measure protein
MATLQDLLIKVGIDSKGVEKGGRDVESKLSKTWSSVKQGAMLGGAAAGLAAGAAIMQGVAQGLESEVATDKLAAQLGATGPQAEVLGAQAGNLYKKGLGDSMETVAQALGAVKTSFAGIADDAIEPVTEKVLNLAKAFEIDTARAAQVAGQAVTSGLAKDATSALDLLTVSMQKVPAAVREDLLDAVDEYGPFMSAIGITGERAFGLLTKSAEKGMYGIDKTGDALKEFGIRATDMSAASKAGYDLLGMSQEKMTAELLKGGDAGAEAFDTIIAGLTNMKDPVKQSQAALALFGTPLEDLGVTEIPKFLSGLKTVPDAMGDVAGATDRLGQTLNDNAASKLEAFKRQAQGALVEQIAKALPYLEQLGGWIQKNSEWLTPLAIAIGVVAAAIAVATAAQWAYNLALAATGIPLIIAAILALVAVIVYLATKTQFFQTIWKNVWGFMKAVGAWFAGPFAAFFVNTWNKITSSLNRAKGQLSTAINTIKSFFVSWYNKSNEMISKIIAKGVQLYNWFKALPGRIGGSLRNMFSGLWAGFRAIVNRIVGAWNNLSFTVGGGSFAGVSLPSVTVSTPNLPYLADGGIVTGPTVAMIGEGRQDEAVIPLDRLPELAGNGDRPIVIELVPGGEREFRRWVNKTVRVRGAVGSAQGAAA